MSPVRTTARSGGTSSVYGVRMARVNVTIPDELHRAARSAGLNVSRLAQQAIAAELVRREKVAALDAYLAELETELGPIPEDERAAARAWSDRVFGASAERGRRS